MREIKYLVVHCSDSSNDVDIGAEEIHSWHLAKGWDGIGYNYVIRRNGAVEAGRPEYWKPSHVKGLNSVSLGVCMVGKDNFTEVQKGSLRLVLAGMLGKYPDAKIVGHCELNPNKTCPNEDVQPWVRAWFPEV
jgi:N-acetylmuramoyl-L-alanine amidase